METFLFFLSCLVGSCSAQLHGKQQLLLEVTLPARVSSGMGLQLLTHQRATGNDPAGSRGLIKLETNKCPPRFLEIHCPGHVGGSEVMVLVCEVFPTSTSALALATSSWIRRAFSQKCGIPSSAWCTQHSCPPLPAKINAQQCKIKAQQSECLICAVSHQEEEAGADPDVLQHLVPRSQGMGWPGLSRNTATQKHCY